MKIPLKTSVFGVWTAYSPAGQEVKEKDVKPGPGAYYSRGQLSPVGSVCCCGAAEVFC